MADLGIGTASLGLQVLQGLKLYYEQFRSYHDDIEAVVQRVKRLESTLLIVEMPLSSLRPEDDTISCEVQACLNLCDGYIKKLETYQTRCGEPEHRPDTLRKRVAHVKQRLAYPFRKSTLEDIQKIRDRLLENLQIILQTLVIDSSKRLHDRTERGVQNMSQQLTGIRSLQSYQTELAKHHYQQSSCHNIRMDHRLTNVEDRVEELVVAISRLDLNHQPIVSPGMLRDSCNSYVELVQPVKKAMTDHRRRIHRSQGLGTLNCFCPKAKRTPSQQYPQSWISTYWFEEQTHIQTCPFYLPSQRSITVGLRLVICRLKLSRLIDFGFTWSASSLSPRITSRNIVSMRNAAQSLLFTLHIFVCTNRDISQNIPALDMAIRSLLKLLQDGRAGIHDVLPGGLTLAHIIFYILGWICASKGVAKIDIKGVIALLKTIGFALNEGDFMGRKPLDLLLRGASWNNSSPYVHDELETLLNDGLEYSWISVFLDSDLHHQYPKVLSLFRYLSPNYSMSYGSEDDPIALSILQRSEIGLENSIRSPGKNLGYKQVLLYGRMAVGWPKGMRILFTLNMLLTVNHWLHAIHTEDNSIIGMVANALGHRSRMWHQANSNPGRKDLNLDYDVLYHTGDMSIIAAQSLFNAGFVDVDINDHKIGTPLWWFVAKCRFLDSKLLLWFLDKGAMLDSIHQVFRTMPVHLIAERLALASLVDRDGHITSENATLLRDMIYQGMNNLDFDDSISSSFEEENFDGVFPDYVEKDEDSNSSFAEHSNLHQ